MAVPNSVYNVSGSSPMLSGVPAFVARAGDFSSHPESYVAPAIEQMIRVCREDLRSRLESDPVWREFADKVDLRWDGNQFSYDFTGSDEEVAVMRRLEYGGYADIDGEYVHTPPRPMLRTHAARLPGVAATVLRDALTKEVGLAS